mmetsp:Transcript_28963/g.81569  ORF Transcript_28963/g.81569 Transcript_28963/m.81569 type:complete len:406 (-) Transcript_28963:650-1867(-)
MALSGLSWKHWRASTDCREGRRANSDRRAAEPNRRHLRTSRDSRLGREDSSLTQASERWRQRGADSRRREVSLAREAAAAVFTPLQPPTCSSSRCLRRERWQREEASTPARPARESSVSALMLPVCCTARAVRPSQWERRRRVRPGSFARALTPESVMRGQPVMLRNCSPERLPTTACRPVSDSWSHQASSSDLRRVRESASSLRLESESHEQRLTFRLRRPDREDRRLREWSDSLLQWLRSRCCRPVSCDREEATAWPSRALQKERLMLLRAVRLARLSSPEAVSCVQPERPKVSNEVSFPRQAAASSSTCSQPVRLSTLREGWPWSRAVRPARPKPEHPSSRRLASGDLEAPRWARAALSTWQLERSMEVRVRICAREEKGTSVQAFMFTEARSGILERAAIW